MFHYFQKQIDTACEIAKFDASFLEYITTPNHIHQMNFSVKLSDGKVHNFDAFRVQHNNLAGPYKGGLRFSKDLNLDEAKTLGAWMTIKTAVLNLPLGGGKGGIKLDPKQLSFDDKEKITRKFVQLLANNIGPDIDIPAPDMYTNASIMAVATDEILKIKGHNALGTFTGKPVSLGGIPGRSEATALGGIIVLEQYLKDHSQSLNGKKVIIQGMGNAGINAAEILSQKGAIVIGVADSKGGLYKPEGLELDSLISCKIAGNSVQSCEVNKGEAMQVSSQEILEKEADILVLAARENVITEDNAEKIQAKLLLELANGPITPEADVILDQAKATILPDVLANAGGVTVSYFEYVQNKNNDVNTVETVHQRLKEFMIEAYRAVKNQSQKYSCNIRQGSYIIALKRLEKLFQVRKSFN